MPTDRRNSNPPKRRGSASSRSAQTGSEPAARRRSSGSASRRTTSTRSSSGAASRSRAGSTSKTRSSNASQGSTRKTASARKAASTRKATSTRKTTSARKSSSGQRTGTRRKAASGINIKMVLPVIIAAIAVMVIIALVVSSCTASTHKLKKNLRYEEDHYWQATVEEAEGYFHVNKDFTDCVLSMIQVESNGDECVDGRHDIMQAWEGDGKKYIENGLKKQGVEPETAQASIYAGVYELKCCIKDFKKFMGYSPDPTDPNDLALLTQGYNYGHLGWFTWLKENGLTEYTVADSESYQSIINGLGTATHGKKIMEAYERISTEQEYTE